MEEFVFAGNRRRWKYLRAVLALTSVALGLWLVACCYVLLSPPELSLRGLRPAGVAPAARHLARGPEAHRAGTFR